MAFGGAIRRGRWFSTPAFGFRHPRLGIESDVQAMRSRRPTAFHEAHWQVPAKPDQISVLRREAASFGFDIGMEDDILDDLRTVVSEAATNAVLHAYGGGAGVMRMELEVRGDRLLVRLRDHGVGVSGRPAGIRNGVGLRVIAALTDSFELHRCHDGGTEARMDFALR
jgi:anti-sigma regulatory factor (Ser/Thr protein kinase)